MLSRRVKLLLTCAMLLPMLVRPCSMLEKKEPTLRIVIEMIGICWRPNETVLARIHRSAGVRSL